jgi:hypothetical protein
MPRPSPLASTNADPASPPAAQPEQSPPAGKRRGNPNLALVPRCGARTRAGCPCRAPAIHGKQRCRMHGGRSTGPRTPEGRARVAAARTKHGGFSAEARAFNRHHVTFMRRGSLRSFAVIHYRLLPPELAARMNPIAPELLVPPRPTCGITRAEDRAMLQAETASLAPWKHAMALARQARRAAAAARAAASGAMAGPPAGPLAPEQAGAAAPGSAASPAATVAARSEAHAPIRPVAAPGAPRHAPMSGGAHALAEPLAPERAAGGARSTKAQARLAGRAKAHAPDRAASAAGTGAAARPDAPTSTRAEPLAPIPSAPAQDAAGQAPAGRRGAQPAQPHATERPGCGAMGGSAPGGSAARPTAHAPNRAPLTRTGSRIVPAGRAARRWLRQQKLMHQKQPAGGQP